jgi:plastocyanin
MERTSLLLLAFIALASVLLSGCAVSQAPPGVPQAGGNKVTIQNFAFSPPELVIKTGTTVTWTNEDSAAHTIASASFNSPILNTGETFSFRFDSPGTFDYSCGIHPSMKGKIIVG